MPHQSNELASCSTPFRVLVVDDDDLQLRAMQRSLRNDKRIELTVATNAIDAMLQIGATKPHLVIMDVFMPGLDGIEACRRIKANPETRDVEVDSRERRDQLRAPGRGLRRRRSTRRRQAVRRLGASCR